MTAERRAVNANVNIRSVDSQQPDAITLALADAIREVARRRADARARLRVVDGRRELTSY